MCGVVGAIAQRDVVPILLEGLKRLEYRGYDSAGIAIIQKKDKKQAILQRLRTQGKVSALADIVDASRPNGNTGIAHTRWATHGAPSENNAHPHISGNDLAVVHNGIIENYTSLATKLKKLGYSFDSDTDTEVIAHLIHHHQKKEHDLLKAVQCTLAELEGAYAIGVMHISNPERIIAARQGSPLIVGVGVAENFIASDVLALAPVTNQVIYLEEGDVVDLCRDSLQVYDARGNKIQRPIKQSHASSAAVSRGNYRNFTQKEIFEQPQAVSDTLEGRITRTHILEQSFGVECKKIFPKIKAVQIIACGTSFHAGLVARNWLEEHAGLPCQVEIASEFRYRRHARQSDTLVVVISQSGETSDTIAALKEAKRLGYEHTLCICNVPESSLVRESELVLLTRAGPEIGVASTKAFTTQLVSLLLLTIALAKHHGLSDAREKALISELEQLPGRIQKILELDIQIEKLATRFADKQNALYLGRGVHYPIALEGALKLKEISYIHAEAYAAGELKHGPLALVDKNMPVIAIAPRDALLEKMKSNIQEVRARGGELFILSEADTGIHEEQNMAVVHLPDAGQITSPILYTLPLQLLAYHVAVAKGTDVDQPRNLAKSVTVE